MWEKIAGFWTARDAWSAAVRQKQAEAPASKRRRPTLDGQRRKWTINAEKYLRTRPSVAKYASVNVAAPDTTTKAMELIEGLPRFLAEEYDDRYTSLLFNAFREWPVDSGFSKASLYGFVQPEGESFFLKVGDSAPYSLFIQGSPARKLIGTPARAAATDGIEAALRRLRG